MSAGKDDDLAVVSASVGYISETELLLCDKCVVYRRYREGSYASKPPRPEDKERRYEERERSRRYNTIERDRHHGERRGERRDRYEARYRDIDPARKHGNLRVERDEDERRRGEAHPTSARILLLNYDNTVACDKFHVSNLFSSEILER